jgi:hypothetical protein
MMMHGTMNVKNGKFVAKKINGKELETINVLVESLG